MRRHRIGEIVGMIVLGTITVTVVITALMGMQALERFGGR